MFCEVIKFDNVDGSLLLSTLPALQGDVNSFNQYKVIIKKQKIRCEPISIRRFRGKRGLKK